MDPEFQYSWFIPGGFLGFPGFLVDSPGLHQELVGECKELDFRVSQRAERNPKGITREESQEGKREKQEKVNLVDIQTEVTSRNN